MAEEYKPAHEEATQGAIGEIEELKMEIVEMLKDAAVKFPVKNKSELKNLFPPGTKMACRVGGKETHFDELAETLNTDDFPLEDASAVASKILSRCSIT
ncbi:MAG: MTH865 family protein [Euryarchaeota archaeon]|nr:MTH865 family protein [Euryarchaeota archaeon]